MGKSCSALPGWEWEKAGAHLRLGRKGEQDFVSLHRSMQLAPLPGDCLEALWSRSRQGQHPTGTEFEPLIGLPEGAASALVGSSSVWGGERGFGLSRGSPRNAVPPDWQRQQSAWKQQAAAWGT